MQRSWTRVVYSNPVCLFEIVALLFSGCFSFWSFLSGCNMPALPPTSVAKLNIIPKLCVVMCRIVLSISYEVVCWASVHLKGLWWTELFSALRGPTLSRYARHHASDLFPCELKMGWHFYLLFDWFIFSNLRHGTGSYTLIRNTF